MLTPPWRKRKVEPEPEAPECEGPSEATLARQKAECELEQTKAETPAYQALAERLRKIRERNNFAAAFRHSIQQQQTSQGRWQ